MNRTETYSGPADPERDYSVVGLPGPTVLAFFQSADFDKSGKPGVYGQSGGLKM